MSRIKRKNKEISEVVSTKTKVPFNKTMVFKAFCILVLISLFLVPVLSMLINMVGARPSSSPVTTQSIEVKN